MADIGGERQPDMPTLIDDDDDIMNGHQRENPSDSKKKARTVQNDLVDRAVASQQPSMADLMCKLNGMHFDLTTQMTSMGTRLTHVENHQTAMSSRIEKLELASMRDKEQNQESIKKL
eukprot:3593363-Amphidinium_carterae.1